MGFCFIIDNEYIIVFLIIFLKWVEVYVVLNYMILIVVDKIVIEFFCRFGKLN